jgi:hypothetical protein
MVDIEYGDRIIGFFQSYKGGNVFVCDNSNLSHRGTPQRQFIDHQRDNYHLNNSGVAQLSANMKSTICAALNIPMFHKQQHPTNKQWNRNHIFDCLVCFIMLYMIPTKVKFVVFCRWAVYKSR